VAATAELGIPDLLARGPRSLDELAGDTGTVPDALVRLLRLGVEVGLLDEPELNRFALTRAGACLSGQDPTTSLRSFALVQAAPGLYRAWERLADAVRTGRPAFPAAHGMTTWEYFRRHPDEGRLFAEAMGGLTARLAPHVAARCDPSRFRRIVDVGGSHGLLLAGLLAVAPEARGVLFDTPEVVAGAGSALVAQGVADRVELVAGDFFTEVPPGGDLYLLKAVLHDWDDEDAARILTNCHRAAASDSVLLVVEGLIPPGPAGTGELLPRLMDLTMLVAEGGRERSRDGYEALLADTGYRLEQVTELDGYWNVLQARRV
jgi:O-methyltransferase domain